MHYLLLNHQNEIIWSCKNSPESHGSAEDIGQDKQVQVVLAENLLLQMTVNWDPYTRVIQENVDYIKIQSCKSKDCFSEAYDVPLGSQHSRSGKA